MDCSTARLFLQLGRPGAPRDLDEPEGTELEAHLAQCHACHQVAHDQDRLDTALGAAMRAVEVPGGLREQIERRLAEQRRDCQRRWVTHLRRGVAAAAAVVALALVLRLLFAPSRPTIDAMAVVRDYNIVRPDKDAADEQLRQLDLRACAPRFVKYGYLLGAPSRAVLPGTEDWKTPVQAAQFVFAHEKHQAVVYAIPQKRFEVELLDTVDQGYTFSLAYKQDENLPYTYLILHTGKDWKWLYDPSAEQ